METTLYLIAMLLKKYIADDCLLIIQKDYLKRKIKK